SFVEGQRQPASIANVFSQHIDVRRQKADRGTAESESPRVVRAGLDANKKGGESNVKQRLGSRCPGNTRADRSQARKKWKALAKIKGIRSADRDREWV